MHKELEQIGLTPGETKVYIALNKCGESTVGPILKESKVAPSKVYEILNRLIEKGLAAYITKEKIKHFQAAPPETLKKYLEEKRRKINEEEKIVDNLIEEINKYSKKSDDKTILFKGFSGILSAYELMLKHTSKNETIKFFYQHSREYENQTHNFYIEKPQFFRILEDQYKQKNIIWKGLYNEKGTDPKKEFMKLKSIKTPLPGNIDISKKCVIITSWAKEPIAIFIQSEEIAKNYETYFDSLWEETINI